MTPDRPIGGFFGLDLPGGSGGLAALWGFGPDIPAWSNATSAFAALIVETTGAVWLPAFLCPELAQAVPPDRRRFYSLTPELAPDLAALAEAGAGDMVLAVNFFGRAPGQDWRDFLAARPALLSVEDCAQSIDTGTAPWGDFRLYSPRKLAGIPDGGFLVSHSEKAALFRLKWPDPPVFADIAVSLAPALARFEAPDDNTFWHPLNQAKEAAQGMSAKPMSTLSRALLSATDPTPLVAQRQANFRVLARQLAAFAVLPETDPGFAPFGFPIRVAASQRAGILQTLYAQRIFPAVHWRDLPVPRSPAWAPEWDMADTFITLPCDQRWTVAEMAMLATVFLQAVENA